MEKAVFLTVLTCYQSNKKLLIFSSFVTKWKTILGFLCSIWDCKVWKDPPELLVSSAWIPEGNHQVPSQKQESHSPPPLFLEACART